MLTTEQISALRNKYGITTPGATSTGGGSSETPEQRIQRLRGETPKKQDSTLVTIAKGLASSFVKTGVTAYNTGSALIDAGQAAFDKATGDEAGYRRNLNEAAMNADKERNVPGMGKVAPVRINLFAAKDGKIGYAGDEKFRTGLKDVVGTGAELASNLIGGGAAKNIAKTGLRTVIKEGAKTGLKLGAETGALYEGGRALQEDKSLVDVAKRAGGGALAGGVLGAGVGAAAPIVSRGLRSSANAVSTAVNKADEIAQKGITKAKALRTKLPGVSQTASDVADRIPRVIDRAAESSQKATERAARIAKSEPAVAKAIKSNLDDRFINSVEEAAQKDRPTLEGYKKMVDIVDTKSPTFSPKQRPEIVAGEAAGTQYKLIDKERQRIGGLIGKEADKLSTSAKLPISSMRAKLNTTLEKVGIGRNGKGQLDFSGTSFTPAERTKVKELFALATEKKTLTPKQIYEKDRLFSKLQREARFEGIGDIIVNTDEGTKSLFNVFRDVYRDTLDELAPNIRGLNKQYRDLSTFVDDIENSIVKGGNFETVKGIDPAEFAQTNLRRIFSDAQSAGAYREIATKMQELSKTLGYEGADPQKLSAFATALRDLYTEAVPQTSATNIFRGGIKGMAERVLEAGAPNTADQQKALREMITSLLSKVPKK